MMRQMMADDPDAPLRMRPQREYRDFVCNSQSADRTTVIPQLT